MHLLVSAGMLWCCWHWQLAVKYVYEGNLSATAKAKSEVGLVSAWGLGMPLMIPGTLCWHCR